MDDREVSFLTATPRPGDGLSWSRNDIVLRCCCFRYAQDRTRPFDHPLSSEARSLSVAFPPTVSTLLSLFRHLSRFVRGGWGVPSREAASPCFVIALQQHSCIHYYFVVALAYRPSGASTAAQRARNWLDFGGTTMHPF